MENKSLITRILCILLVHTYILYDDARYIQRQKDTLTLHQKYLTNIQFARHGPSVAWLNVRGFTYMNILVQNKHIPTGGHASNV
jgi:hypothetical protein